MPKQPARFELVALSWSTSGHGGEDEEPLFVGTREEAKEFLKELKSSRMESRDDEWEDYSYTVHPGGIPCYMIDIYTKHHDPKGASEMCINGGIVPNIGPSILKAFGMRRVTSAG